VCDLKLSFALTTTAILKINQHWLLLLEMNEPQWRERPKWTLWFTLPPGKCLRKFLLQFPIACGKLDSDAEQTERHQRASES
jgi:hypothetical protein